MGGPASSEVGAWAAHLVAARALRTVLEQLDEAGVPALPVKGVILAYRLYADPAARPISDIDLRVLPEDVRRTRDAGLAAGWPLRRYSAPYANVVFDVEGGLQLDVEGTVGPPGLCGLRVADMLARSRVEVAPLGFAHRVPELHDHALLVMVNAYKDRLLGAWERTFVDLERFVIAPGFDPDRLAGLAREARASTLAWVVADWMVTARGCAAWEPTREALWPPARRGYARAIRHLVGRLPAPLERLAMRAASDRKREAAGAVLRALVWQADLWWQYRTKAPIPYR